MSLIFEPISLARQDDYLSRLRSMPQLSSDYSFVNLFAWAEEYGLTWAWDSDLVWIKQESPVQCLWAPVGDWEKVDWLGKCAGFSEKLPFYRIPQKCIDISNRLASLFEIRESRDHWDYIYSAQELIDLKGNRFHKKKNLLRQFQKNFTAEFISLDKRSIEKVLMMQLNWCATRNCEASAGLSAENRVISKVLHLYDSFKGILGGSLVVDNEIVAFTVAERLDNGTIVVHFEKGIQGYKGVYQAINQMFLAAQAGVEKVNREQDLGNEGLRKAKLSYNPIDFIKKYELQWF